MKDIIHKFTKLGNPVVDAFSGTFSVVNPCMLLHKPRITIACDMYAICMTEARPQLILLDTRQVLSRKSDSDAHKEVCRSAVLYIKYTERNEMRTRLDILEVAKGLPPIHALPPHIMNHICTCFGKVQLFQKQGIFQQVNKVRNDGPDCIYPAMYHYMLFTIELLVVS